MAIQAAIPLAGKLLPFLIKAGSAAKLPTILRTVGGVTGAAPGVLRGDWVDAVTCGLLVTERTGLGSGALRNVGQGAAGLTAQAIGRSGWGAQQGLGLAGNLAKQELGSALAGAAVPTALAAASGLYTANQVAPGINRAGGETMDRVTGIAGQTIGQTPNQPLNSIAISPEHLTMGRGPDGGPMYYLDPRGIPAGGRVGSGLDTRQNISNQNAWYNAQLPQWDEIERRKQARAIQNAQLSSNINLARNLALNRQAADLNIAQTGATSMANMFQNTAVPTIAF